MNIQVDQPEVAPAPTPRREKLPDLPKEYKKTITLPLSKQEVVLVAPKWRDRKLNKRAAEALKLDAEEATLMLIATSTFVDGEKLLSQDDFDDWQYHDIMFLYDAFNDWEGTAGPNGKN